MTGTPRPHLRTGCRRGEQAALDALLYGSADAVYSLALAAVSDEAEAQECLRETWRRVLEALGRPRFEQDPSQRVWRVAQRVVAERVGVAAAEAARNSITRPDGTVGLEGVRPPEELLQELSALSAQHAPLLQLRWRQRRHAYRVGLVVLFVTAVAVWGAVFYQRAQRSHSIADLQYRCLRQRVIEQDLADGMRIAAEQLEDPEDTDRAAAANCERIILVLEEIANNERLDQVARLRYIRQRVTRDQLAEFARTLPRDSAELQKILPRVALVLEEVENL